MGITHPRHAVARGIFVAACCVAAVSAPGALPGLQAQAPQRSVLAVFAARRDAPASVLLDRLFQRALNDGIAENVDYYSEYIDVARFADPSFQPALRDFLARKYRAQRFDLLIASSDTAADFLRMYRDTLFPGVPVVFGGVAANPGPHSTGVVAGISMTRTLDLVMRLQPDVRRIVVVSGASAFDKFYEDLARQQFAAYEDRLEFTYLSGLPMPELIARVSQLPRDAICYSLTIAQDGSGLKVLPLDALDMIAAAANVPIYSWNELALGHGIVGGGLQSVDLVGGRIARLALRVLKGERPEDIPVETLDSHVDQVDWRQLQRWGISEARVPAGVLVRNREPGIWERYKVYIAGALSLVALQTILIAGLLVQRSRRRRVENALRESERRYSLATVSGAVGVWDWNLKTDEIYVDPELKLLLGYTDEEIPNRLQDWGAKIHPEDAERTLARARDCIDGRTSVYEVEHRMVHKDGSIRWFLARGSVITRADGTPHRLVGTDTDITQRKEAELALVENQAALRTSYEQIQDLAGRLIAAQEAERSRIARDLHDDVSQQLAGLSITLSALKQRLKTMVQDGEVEESLSSLQQRTFALATNIRGLSHDLHPGVLQHAGLVPALSAHCDEFEHRHRIRVAFHAADDLGAVDSQPALCLYRVAQEALTNVARHARANFVEVKLLRAAETIELTVADNGVGFNGTRDRKARGLGLRSIDERVRIARGTLSLESWPDGGTRLQVRIPAPPMADVAGA